MKQFEIGWTFGGSTTVEANTEAEAREKFNALDHIELCTDAIEDDPCLDVRTVDPL